MRIQLSMILSFMTMSVVTGTDYQSSDPFLSVVDPNNEMEDFVTRNLQNVVFYAPTCPKANNISLYDVSISIALTYNTKLRPLPCDGNDDIAIGSMLQTVVATFDVSGGLIENYAFTTFLCSPKSETDIVNVRKLESLSAGTPVKAPKGRKLTATRSPTRAPTVRPSYGWIIPGGGGCKLCNPDDGDLRADLGAEEIVPPNTITTSAITVDTSLSKAISPVENAIKAMEITLKNAIVAALLKNTLDIKCLKGAIADVVVKVILRDSLSPTPFGCVNK